MLHGWTRVTEIELVVKMPGVQLAFSVKLYVPTNVV